MVLTVVYLRFPSAGSATPGRVGGTPPTILCSKKKKRGKKGKKIFKSFKEETIKRLSSKSKCYCSSYSRASRIQTFFLSANFGEWLFFSVFRGPSPPLPSLHFFGTKIDYLSKKF